MFILPLLIPPVHAVDRPAPDTRKEVLFLNSYHRGQEWSDPITDAIEETFRNSGTMINLHVEYMDSKRFSNETYIQSLSSLYAHKYHDIHFDVIISSDDNALQFLRDHRDSLFPGVPVIFCGVNFFTPDMISRVSGFTGVVETFDVKSTVDAALLLQPDIREVFVINDASLTGAANKKVISEVIPGYEGRLNFTFLEEYTIEELLEKVATLPDKSIILLMTFNQDRAGKDYSYLETLELLYPHAEVPIYAIWELYIGHGIVGGMLTSGYTQGHLASAMALEVLNGTDPGSIPVLIRPENQYIFDYREMKRFGLQTSSLPPGSRIVNGPSELVSIPGYVIWTAAISGSCMILLIGVLFYSNRRLRQSRDALDESERRYKAVVEDQEEFILRMKPDGEVVFVNDAFCRFFQKKDEEILGRSDPAPLPPAHMHSLMNHFGSLSPEHPSGILVDRIVTPHGHEKWVRWSNRAIYTERGELKEYQSVGRDFSDLKNAEVRLLNYQKTLESQVETRTRELATAYEDLQKEMADRIHAEDLLAAEKERLSVTLNSIMDGVISTDLYGSIIFMNRAAQHLTGWDARKAEGHHLDEVFSVKGEVTDADVDLIAEVREGSGGVGIEKDLDLVTRTRERIPVSITAAPLFDMASRTAGIVIVFRDITMIRKYEQEMIKSQKLEAIGVLAGGIAHDFNNILTTILGHISLAGLEDGDSASVRMRLCGAENAVQRARFLTQRLLTFSRGSDPVRRVVDINTLVRDSVGLILSGSRSKPVFSIPEDIWSVEADPLQIGQVIQNLVINADQAMPDGGVITLEAANVRYQPGGALSLLPGKYVAISVIDHGKGIPDELQSRIFEPYFTNKPEGSGFGLPAALSIVKKHGGTIDLSSTVGEGSRFTIYIPAADEKEKGESPATREPAPAGGHRILILDDEPGIREVLHTILTKQGYQVDAVADGKDAISFYKEGLEKDTPYDLVIVDLTIPGGMGGLPAFQQIRKMDPYVRGLVSSGYSSDPVMADFRAYGFSGVIQKPYSLEEVTTLVRELLGEDRHKEE